MYIATVFIEGPGAPKSYNGKGSTAEAAYLDAEAKAEKALMEDKRYKSLPYRPNISRGRVDKVSS